MSDIFSKFYDHDSRYKAEYKFKSYPHFDTQLNRTELSNLLKGIQKKGVLPHKFYPFIKYYKKKYKRVVEGEDEKIKDKPRPIMHTARLDSQIYGHYRAILMNQYEPLLENLGINDSVIAYRKISIEGNSLPNKCNVHFANEAIDEIIRATENYGGCCAVAVDVKGFFDNLDHKIIKKQWKKVLNCNELPADHQIVYRNITQFRYIESIKLEKILDLDLKKISIENYKLIKANKKIKKESIPNRIFHNLHLKVCSDKNFRELIVPNLEPKNKVGIPQGTPISDVIANMYMLDFDMEMANLAKELNGYYRRYSDDILFICNLEQQDIVIKKTSDFIALAKLKISPDKTILSHFKKTSDGIIYNSFKGAELNPVAKPFEYLGLSFDGKEKKLRQSTISNYRRKLNNRIKKEMYIAEIKLKAKERNINKESLYKMISFDLIKNSCMKNKIPKTDERNGNFYTYVELVANVTTNNNVMNIFDNISSWIKKRAKKHCEKHLA